jgi:hypothetical protein
VSRVGIELCWRLLGHSAIEACYQLYADDGGGGVLLSWDMREAVWGTQVLARKQLASTAGRQAGDGGRRDLKY